jgi:hypothetical protein
MDNHRQISIVLIVLCLSAVICADGAVVDSIILCEQASADSVGGVEHKESFGVQTSGIVAVVGLKEVKPGTRVKGCWVAVDTVAVSNYEIDSAEVQLTKSGDNVAQFAISKPDNDWPVGKYKLDVYVDGQLSKSAFFEVASEGGAEPLIQAGPGSGAVESGQQLDKVAAEKLKVLEAAHQAGVLTDEEYNRKKEELLSQAARAAVLDPATMEKLKALEAAHEAGILSEQEYEKKKGLVGQVAAPAAQPVRTGLTMPRVGGQTFLSEAGFSFWHPTGWTVKQDKDSLQLMPPNPLSAAGIPTEVYFMYVKQVAVKDLGALANSVLSGYIQMQAQSFFSLLKQAGPASSIETGQGTGLVYNWETDLLKGLGIILVARAYIGQVNNSLVTLIGFGPKQLVEARDGDLRNIFTSLGSAQAQTPFGAGGGGLPLFGGGGAPGGGPMSPGGATGVPSAGLSGTYTLASGGVTVTLTLIQDAQGGISGTLSSTSGMQFQLMGQVANGVATGRCYNNQLNVFFQGQLQGNQLLFSMIEPNANNMPDYSNVQQLTFTRQSGGVPGMGGGQPPAYGGAQPPAYGGSQPPVYGGAQPPAYGGGQQAPGQMGAGGGLIDSGLGFRFQCPVGWQSQQDGMRVVLSNSGMGANIVIFPHMDASFQQVQANMQRGLAEENLQLSLISGLQPLGNNAVAGDYAGIMNGQQVKARGIGTFSGSGGGAYILAIAAAAQYSGQLSAVADSVARGLQYTQGQGQSSGLMQYFAGTWKTYTQMTETTVHLSADGRYFENYVASYGGTQHDVYGNEAMVWGAATDQSESGRWSVRGNREQGVLTIVYKDGSQEAINYRVHVEKGQVYWNEYLFDGTLWSKQQ